MYEIVWAPPAMRQMRNKIPLSVGAAIWEFVNGPLAENPYRVGKQLRGELAGRWCARRGEYRVIYSIDDDVVTVYILRIDHRRDVYRPS